MRARQQPQLERAQHRLRPADRHPVAAEVELEAAHGEHDVVRHAAALRAPQDRGDADDQLGRRERLGQVVVGALGQGQDPVADRAPRREHQDRHVAVQPGAPDDLDPVDLGDHQVEDHEPRVLGDGPERRPPVARR